MISISAQNGSGTGQFSALADYITPPSGGASPALNRSLRVQWLISVPRVHHITQARKAAQTAKQAPCAYFTASAAWYKLRTSGPDSTCAKPISYPARRREWGRSAAKADGQATLSPLRGFRCLAKGDRAALSPLGSPTRRGGGTPVVRYRGANARSISGSPFLQVSEASPGVMPGCLSATSTGVVAAVSDVRRGSRHRSRHPGC
jgi:hypothetical protein